MEQRQRSVLLIYGEETENINIRVPKSKKKEVKERFYAVLKEFEDPKNVLVDCVSNKTPDLKPEKVSKQKELVVPEKNTPTEKKGYEFVDSVPWGAIMINIIGHKAHKNPDSETYYVKLSEGNGFKVVVLHSEKEVKEFIRKEIIK